MAALLEDLAPQLPAQGHQVGQDMNVHVRDMDAHLRIDCWINGGTTEAEGMMGQGSRSGPFRKTVG